MAGSFREADRTPVDTYVRYVRRYVPYVRTVRRCQVGSVSHGPEATRRALHAAQGRGTAPLRGDRARSPRSSRSSATRSCSTGARPRSARSRASTPAPSPAATARRAGVISNLFGSQAAFQAETMERALDAGDWIESLDYPAPADHPDAGAWLDALFAAESARGPLQGRQAEGGLRLAVGAVAEHRPLRASGASASAGPAWRRTCSGWSGSSRSSARRSTTSAACCATARPSPTSPARWRA